MKTLTKISVIVGLLLSSVVYAENFERHDFNARIDNAQKDQDGLAKSIGQILQKEDESNKDSKEVKKFLESEIEWYEDSHIVNARDITKDRAPNSVVEDSITERVRIVTEVNF